MGFFWFRYYRIECMRAATFRRLCSAMLSGHSRSATNFGLALCMVKGTYVSYHIPRVPGQQERSLCLPD
jgi:hypothetical protein